MFLLFLLAATALSQGVASTKVFYVTPNTSAIHLCYHSPCHTLDQYASNHSLLEGHTNITLIFLTGEHTLNSDLLISGVDQLSMQAQETAMNDDRQVVVTFQPRVKTSLGASTLLKIEKITLKYHKNLAINGSSRRNFSIQLLSVTLDSVIVAVRRTSSIHVDRCRANSSTLTIFNVANITITKTTFFRAGLQPSAHDPGALVICSRRQRINIALIIQNCKFRNNYHGIEIKGPSVMKQLKIFITKTLFAGNFIGILIPYNIGLQSGEIKITDTIFKRNKYGVDAAKLELMILESTITHSMNFGLITNNINATIIGSNITNNRIGITSSGSTLHLQSSNIADNVFGLVIKDFNKPGTVESDSVRSFIQDCEFFHNKLSGITLIHTRGDVEVQDCRFYRNEGTPIIAYNSAFELKGETVFQENTADRGGGLALYHSTVTFGPGSNTQFTNNTALEYGGAIYTVSLQSIPPKILIDIEEFIHDDGKGWKFLQKKKFFQNDNLFKQKCFFAFSKASKSGPQVTFTGNSATHGGLDIYGPTLYTKDCSITNNNLFRFDDKEPRTLQVSSKPSRVCFCVGNIPQCETSHLVMNQTRYPGEHFSVQVVLTGYNFGRVAGYVYTNVVGQNYNNVIDKNQHVQPVTLPICTTLTYNISSHDQILEENNSSTILLALTVQEKNTPDTDDFESSLRDSISTRCNRSLGQPPCTALLTTPVYLKVELRECPLGFERDNVTGACECDRTTRYFTHDDDTPLTCAIRNQSGYITRKDRIWIGTDKDQSKADLYYWYDNCPKDYCKSSEVDVDLRYPDVQCEASRGGVLCGSCQNNFSLILGSNKCERCKNNRISLVIIFAVFGILLVVLITTLDLTVASATINGLIFYANIVWSNNAILFSPQNAITRIIVPIAWINLDFGIETCFCENLDQLTNTGLQFVFPVYIWCIAGLIIIISHHSIRATKLFGNNSVAMLATLLLLSYGKLFKTIIAVFRYANITDSNNASTNVWYLDGNVHYNDLRHVGLIMVALTFFLFFVLPFTLLLLLTPFLRTKSNLRPLRWINKLTPFLDTYTGPFKHKKRYHVWTGILLVARVVILITSVSIPTNYPNANILLTVVSTLLLLYVTIVGLLYKKLYVSLLEVSYLFNLIILGGVFLFHETPDGKYYNSGAIISLLIALLQLAGTLLFHTVRRILSIERIQACFKQEPKPAPVEIELEKREPTPHITDVNNIYDSSRFRESLFVQISINY